MSVPPRVLSLATSYPRDDSDHAGSFVQGLHLALRRAGCEVTTLCPEHPGAPLMEESSAGTVIRVPYRRKDGEGLFYGDGLEANLRSARAPLRSMLRFLRNARAEIRRRLPSSDLLLAHWLVPSGLAFPGRRVRGTRPLIGIGHGGDLFVLSRPIIGRLFTLPLLRRFDALLATSEAGKRILARRFPGVPCDVSPMGVDPSSFLSSPVSGASSSRNGPLLAVGRLVPIKGFDLAIQAAARVSRPLEIVGDGPERAALEVLSKSLGADVRFLGRVPRDRLRPHYERASALIVPSRRLPSGRTEGFPVVVMEALAAGLPVVASRTGGFADRIPAELTFESDDLEGLVTALALVEAEPARGLIPPVSTAEVAALLLRRHASLCPSSPT